MSTPRDRVDVVVVGGGHNGLTAAAYLGRAGLSVLLLERAEHLGGATVSAEAFPGTGAMLSRYSYLVSLMPRQIIDDLGLSIALRRRRYSSYTPKPGTDVGLLIDNEDHDATRASFAAVGAERDHEPFGALYARTGRLAQAVWPTMTDPLPRRSDLQQRLGDERIWQDFIERPLGEAVSANLRDDLVRGVVLTDGLISTFARSDQADLAHNICFLYHVVGGGTGAWDVPVGGMGQVSGALADAARGAGARLEVGAEVTGVDDGTVTYVQRGTEHQVQAGHVLWGAAPGLLDQLQGAAPGPSEGAQVKVNVLLRRLPRLLDGSVSPDAAFGGTFHVNETATQLDTAYDRALAGQTPEPIPAEIYCHSLTDPSILSPRLQASGAHTLTVFALQVPHRLMDAQHREQQRQDLERQVLSSLSSVLGEPIEDVILTGPDGSPCVETRTTLDLEESLAMPGGNIFHGPLQWPFAEDDEPLTTPAERWGVATPYPGVLLCGAGSRRGGGVSGLGGYHAARAVLEAIRD